MLACALLCDAQAESPHAWLGCTGSLIKLTDGLADWKISSSRRPA